MNLRMHRTFKWVRAQPPLGMFGTPYLPPWTLQTIDTLQVEDSEGHWVNIPFVIEPAPPKPETP